MPRCAAKKPDGAPCERIVGESATYCYSHDPSRQDDRHRAASKAARSKVPAEISDIKARLREFMDGVVEDHLDKGRVAVAAQVAGVLARYIDLERKIKEAEELEARLEKLEDALEQEPYGRSRRSRSTWGV